MASTNSADKHINACVSEPNEEKGIYELENNSAVSECINVNSGNEKVDFKKLKFNQTYTLSSTGDVSQVNGALMNTDEPIGYKDGSTVDSSLTDIHVYIYGHPNKFIYDYQQGYSNCGVDSCLNVLSMAGVKDIVQITKEYEDWLSTPEIVEKKVLVWNESLGDYVEELQKVEVYPKAPTATEDQFLLWAVQNSKNDAIWMAERNEEDYDPQEFKDIEASYTYHAKNCNEYQSIKDLQESPKEVGSTTATQRNNILNDCGVKATIERPVMRLAMKGVSEAAVQTSSEYYLEDEDGNKRAVTLSDGTEKLNEKGEVVKDEAGNTVYVFKNVWKVTTEEKWDSAHKSYSKTTTTSCSDYEGIGVYGDVYGLVEIETYEETKVIETTNTSNREYYKEMCDNFIKWIDEGKGVILAGFANALLGNGEKGGPHGITLVGYVIGECYIPSTTTTITTTKVGDEDRTNTKTESDDTIYDITGFYVMDTGGFLTGEPECPQYVSIEKLYDFLTDTTYIDEVFDPNNPKHFARIEANVTVENIRAWANDLNLTGTNRKNVLYGNDGKNVIKGEAGNDVIYGREGNDTLYGGNDNDTIIGGAGDDLMDGGKGDDTYIISSDDLMQNDVIIMNSGRDSINFRNDILAEIDRNSFSFTNENGSLIIKYQTVSRISSQRYDNTIKIQDYFNKNLLSNFESIVFTTFIGNDPNNNNYPLYEYNGREGVLDIFYKNPINYTVEQDKSNNFVGSKLNDSVTGGNKNDTITGADGYDTICGGNGSDLIKMGNNNDIVYGSNGDDKIYTENGVNYITYENANGHTYSGFDTIFGSSKGRDYIEMKEKSSSDISYQKAGNDLVIVYNQATGDSVTISSYFKKKGKTSVKSLELSDDTIDLVYDYGTISSQAQSGSKTTGTSAYDTLKGGAGSDSINGLQGHDMIYGGAGNDILVGGAGNDKLYGQAGENTYKFSTNDGNDTINFTKNTTSIIDISATGLEVDLLGISDSLNDGFSYTKSNNDLIINYGTSVDNADKNIITIANYFKQNGDFIIKGANDTEVALKDAFIRFEGEIEASNKLTTSQYNDYITGGILADTINAGKGNDIIYTGLGDDIITGGADSNEIYYYKGDGNDTINLTKGENLTINIVDIEKNELKFEVVKNDLVISYLDDDAKEQKITLKNFGTKDVVNNATKKAPDTSSVKIYLSSSDETIDLKKDIFLPYYVEFTPTKNSYTGTWFSDFIDARDMNIFSIDDNKGANINAGKGNDIIYGCMYNDTIKGGDGNDYINAYGGNNNLDGGNGSDTYRIFYDKDYIVLRENSTIKDTGKGATDKDTVLIESKKDNIDVWFNINKKGKTNYAINVIEYSDATKRSEINYATITNVEDIIVNGMTTETTDDLRYDYDNETLKQQVIAFLNNRGYKDAAQVFNGGALRDQEDLMAIYNNDTYWETV